MDKLTSAQPSPGQSSPGLLPLPLDNMEPWVWSGTYRAKWMVLGNEDAIRKSRDP